MNRDYELPTPYGTGALEPPDEPAEDPADYLPAPTGHREGERVNWASYCVECGEPWPCETVDPSVTDATEGK